MTAVAAAVDALFADANIACDAVYIAEGGSPRLVRVVARRADEITGFGEARLWSETTRIDLRVAEVPEPRPGDRVELDGERVVRQERLFAGLGHRFRQVAAAPDGALYLLVDGPDAPVLRVEPAR